METTFGQIQVGAKFKLSKDSLAFVKIVPVLKVEGRRKHNALATDRDMSFFLMSRTKVVRC